MAYLGPMLTQMLRRYGLTDLTSWVSDMIAKGASEEEVQVSIYDQPKFRDRFWMIFQRSKQNHPAISVDEVLEFERTASAAAKSFGIQLSMKEIGNFIVNNVSVAEAQDRIGLASQVVHMSSRDLRAQLERLYGITGPDLTRYWLNPKEQAPVLQRRFVAAQVAEQAQRSGWGQLTSRQAEDLVQKGADAEAAAKGFGTLVDMSELFEAVDTTEQDVSVEKQLSLITGNREAQKEIETRGEKRAAKFKEAGGFAAGETGFGGLGSAAT